MHVLMFVIGPSTHIPLLWRTAKVMHMAKRTCFIKGMVWDRGNVAVCCCSGAFQQHPNIKQLKHNLKMLHLQMNINE